MTTPNAEYALDDVGNMTAKWETWPEGDALLIRPCGLDGVLLRPEQVRRLLSLLKVHIDGSGDSVQ